MANRSFGSGLRRWRLSGPAAALALVAIKDAGMSLREPKEAH